MRLLMRQVLMRSRSRRSSPSTVVHRGSHFPSWAISGPSQKTSQLCFHHHTHVFFAWQQINIKYGNGHFNQDEITIFLLKRWQWRLLTFFQFVQWYCWISYCWFLIMLHCLLLNRYIFYYMFEFSIKIFHFINMSLNVLS